MGTIPQPQAGEKPPELYDVKHSTSTQRPDFVNEDGTFNPYSAVCGFYPPDVIARRTDFTDGQKRVFERMVRWAGRQGTVFGKPEAEMAKELGMPKRNFQRHLAAVESKGLIDHRRLFQKANVYTFLWHSSYQREFQLQDAPPMAQPDAPPVAQGIWKELCPNQQPRTKQENPLPSSSSSSVTAHDSENAPSEKTDDDEMGDTLLEKTSGRTGIPSTTRAEERPNHSGKAKSETTALWKTGERVATPFQLPAGTADIDAYRAAIQCARNREWDASRDPDWFGMPDEAITRKILSYLLGHEDLVDWLDNFCSLGKEAGITGNGYAFMRADAERWDEWERSQYLSIKQAASPTQRLCRHCLGGIIGGLIADPDESDARRAWADGKKACTCAAGARWVALFTTLDERYRGMSRPGNERLSQGDQAVLRAQRDLESRAAKAASA